MQSRISTPRAVRGTATAAAVVTVSAAAAFAVTSPPAAGEQQSVAPAATRITPLPHGTSMPRAGGPASRRAARSASRTVSYDGDPRGIAAAMAAERHGWGADQFSCLSALWERESGWDVHAASPSGAYGIPQAQPGSKMSTAGRDWRDDPATQVAWGLDYIDRSHGTPCKAWSAFRSLGWY
ncbi:MAG: transglycosylase SLT domain-containing protein [Nocardioides sp.]